MGLETDLAAVLNSASAENGSDTPDFILAQYLLGCLQAWDTAIQARNKWYGRAERKRSTYDPEAPR